MPEDPGAHGSVRVPALGDELEFGEGGRHVELEHLQRCGPKGLIAVRRHVGAQQTHREVDVGRPTSDPGMPHQLGPDLVVGKQIERRQVEAGERRCGKRPRVAALLSAEPDPPQTRIVEREEGFRCDKIDRRDEPVEGPPSRRQLHLLLQDQVNDRRKARFPRPERRPTEPVDGGPQEGIDTGEPRSRVGDSTLGQPLHAVRETRTGGTASGTSGSSISEQNLSGAHPVSFVGPGLLSAREELAQPKRTAGTRWLDPIGVLQLAQSLRELDECRPIRRPLSGTVHRSSRLVESTTKLC